MTGKQPRQLPPTPHIEHLRKEAKQRFALLKLKASGTRLADAQYWLARDYGFSNWRALKEEVMRRMGMVRMAPAPARAHRRFQPAPISPDEELEANFFFMRGAAVMGIGVIAALVIVAYVVLMILSGRAVGHREQRPAAGMERAQIDQHAGHFPSGRAARHGPS